MAVRQRLVIDALQALATATACWVAMSFIQLQVIVGLGSLTGALAGNFLSSVAWFHVAMRVLEVTVLMIAAVPSFALGWLVARLLPRGYLAELAIWIAALAMSVGAIYVSGQPSRPLGYMLLTNAAIALSALAGSGFCRSRRTTLPA
ncbi:MAG: hypothetical protein JNL19_02445 [Burkholderiales bacterium]|nr:hypothetical protein [Burkholderiales bacterium]